MTANSSTTSGKAERFQNSYILQAWLVISLALFFGISLAGIQSTLGPMIETNKKNETREQVPEIILGNLLAKKMAESNSALMIQPHSITIKRGNRKKSYNVFETRYPDGRLAGWVTKATGQGYADKIELLFGLDPEVKQLTGLFILGQKETPGLGNKIIEKQWRDQFIKKSTDRPFEVVKGGTGAAHEIDAITGATISSKSVVDIINKSVADIKGQLSSLSAVGKKDKE
ncbi:MAG: FMN-binding protein [Desulfobacterales bacterium]